MNTWPFNDKINTIFSAGGGGDIIKLNKIIMIAMIWTNYGQSSHPFTKVYEKVKDEN